MVSQVLAEWGQIDILVNCAGVNSLTTLFDTTMKRFDLLWNVNVRAPLHLMQLVARSRCQ